MTLSLAMQEAEVVEDCSTQQGLTLAVHAVIVFKVGDDAIVDATKHEMARIGLAVDSLQISSIDDRGVGYIAALAAPHQAAVNHAAKIAQAVADQAAAQAQQESARNQAEYARQTAVARAQFQAVIDQAEQRAAQAGPLAAAQAMQDALVEQARVAQRNADLRQAQLIAEVIKPAEAEAEAVRTLAKAHADAVKLSAEAAAVQGRIALDQKVIEQLPDMLRAAAEGLQGADLTVLDGAEGLSGVVASLAGQGMALLDAVRGGLGGPQPSDTPALDAKPRSVSGS
jgi:flotillin